MTKRRKITTKTKAWIFRKAWEAARGEMTRGGVSLKHCLKRSLKYFWAKARKAAGIIAMTSEDFRNMGGIDGVLSLKALAQGKHVRAFGGTHASYYSNWGA